MDESMEALILIEQLLTSGAISFQFPKRFAKVYIKNP